ncbi:hypothetical protein [Nonomuraea angiospora]
MRRPHRVGDGDVGDPLDHPAGLGDGSQVSPAYYLPAVSFLSVAALAGALRTRGIR